jgi:hypothetical protein
MAFAATASKRGAFADMNKAAKPSRHILIAVARYLAAHSPTERALLQPHTSFSLYAGEIMH